MLKVVMQASKYGNVLEYDTSKSEYIYYHNNRKIWTEKADSGLYDYVRQTFGVLDEVWTRVDRYTQINLEKFPVYTKYDQDCRSRIDY